MVQINWLLIDKLISYQTYVTLEVKLTFAVLKENSQRKPRKRGVVLFFLDIFDVTGDALSQNLTVHL